MTSEQLLQLLPVNLAEKLLEEATQQFRTVEQQLAFILNDRYKAKTRNPDQMSKEMAERYQAADNYQARALRDSFKDH